MTAAARAFLAAAEATPTGLAAFLAAGYGYLPGNLDLITDAEAIEVARAVRRRDP